MLRDHPVVDEYGNCSDTLYIRGFPKSESDESVREILAVVIAPVAVDLSFRSNSGQVWAKYSDADIAAKTLLRLHLKCINGSVLSVKYELGLDESGKRIVDRGSHNTVIRSVGRRKVGVSDLSCQRCGNEKSSGSCSCASSGSLLGIKKRKGSGPQSTGVSYSSNSLFVGDLEYPFPSGLYLSRVIELSIKKQTCGTTDPLVSLVTDTISLGNKYPKEISESMAMADATLRAISLLPPALRVSILGCTFTSSVKAVESSLNCLSSPDTVEFPNVAVFVLGDGCRPITAACMCLHLPSNFVFYSVDPLMRQELCCSLATTSGLRGISSHQQQVVANPYYGKYGERFFPLAMFSQDFLIPDCISDRKPILSIVVSCHSHAPLQEFWDRLEGPKVAITMACCAEYGEINSVPVLDFEDFEVYSPKRRVKIFVDL